MRVVSLDIDGVLNHCDTRHAVTPTDAEPLPIPIATECMATERYMKLSDAPVAPAKAFLDLLPKKFRK